MRVAIPREIHPGERRVAATPGTVRKLRKLGFEVLVEKGAGAGASFADERYAHDGAEIVTDPVELWQRADLVLKVLPPQANPATGVHEADLLHEGQTLVSFIWPAKNKELLERMAARKVTVLAMDQVPRISRAQKMDALSTMANIAGYRAVIEAASFYGRFFTGQMTAAGRVAPARVLVIGAGVAGLASIGAARGLGAVVRAFDTRTAAKDQVKSMGAEFIEVAIQEEGEGSGGYARVMSEAYHRAEVEMLTAQCSEVDIIITTALIPNHPAPVLITGEMVKLMKKGSVIVDLAAEGGGNCELTEPGTVVNAHGVTVVGFVDMPSRLAPTASMLYGGNLTAFIDHLGGTENFRIDVGDEVVRGALVLHNGALTWPPPRKEAPPAPATPATPAGVAAPAAQVVPSAASLAEIAVRKKRRTRAWITAGVVLAAVALVALGLVAPPAFLSHLTVFILAIVIGWQVVWNVTPALHTPLMSVTNAISGIIVIGGLLQMRGPLSSPAVLLGAAAILVAMINVVGGFTVTQRMLRMFQR